LVGNGSLVDVVNRDSGNHQKRSDHQRNHHSQKSLAWGQLPLEGGLWRRDVH